jgi:hypothetical protein
MANALMNKLNRELNKLEKEVELATSYIPDGYKVAKDTLSERVKLMVEGLNAYSKERQELLQKIVELEDDIDDMHYQSQMNL